MMYSDTIVRSEGLPKETVAMKKLCASVIQLMIEDIRKCLRQPNKNNLDAIPFMNTDEFLLMMEFLDINMEVFEEYISHVVTEKRVQRIYENLPKIYMNDDLRHYLTNAYREILEKGFKWQKKKTSKTD